MLNLLAYMCIFARIRAKITPYMRDESHIYVQLICTYMCVWDHICGVIYVAFWFIYVAHICCKRAHIYVFHVDICATIYVVIRAYTWEAEHIYVHI